MLRLGGCLLAFAAGACSFTPTPAGATPIDSGGEGDVGSHDFLRQINVGSSAVTGIDFPGSWEADSQDASVCGPLFWPVTEGIKNTVDDALFTTHVYGLPTVTCAITGIPPGTYEVTILFGPTYFGPGCDTPGDQRFSIQLESTIVETDYNLSAETLGCVRESGTNPAAHPIAKTYTVTIDDTLDILETSTNAGAAMVSAIQIASP